MKGQHSLAQENILLKKNEILYRQQEKFNGFYFLKSGVIKTFWLKEQGDHTIADFYFPGELLAFSSLHTQHYVENAQALRDVELCRIPLPLLMHRLNEDETYQSNWFGLLSACLNRAEKARYRYVNASAAQKVALFLVDYNDRLAGLDKEKSDVHLLPTQQDIANYLGLTAETISRIYAQFQQQGLVQFFPAKQIISLAHEKLQALINNQGN